MMSDNLSASLTVLVNMVNVYIVFSVSLGGFSWPAHHGGIVYIALYYASISGLGYVGLLFAKHM